VRLTKTKQITYSETSIKMKGGRVKSFLVTTIFDLRGELERRWTMEVHIKNKVGEWKRIHGVFAPVAYASKAKADESADWVIRSNGVKCENN
jgi:hypothetical protein